RGQLPPSTPLFPYTTLFRSIIRGLNARAQTPQWMKQRLERSGQRSISALVDISNYVMLELGRPTHVFDLDKIHGGLEVRWGRKRSEEHTSELQSRGHLVCRL